MTTAAKKNQVKNEIVILTATSGDTGKAALAGFADVPGTKIIVFYPKTWCKSDSGKTDGNTERQTIHMLWELHGNFDDAQSGRKENVRMIKNWQQNLMKQDISSHLRTLSISDVWYRRSFIMYMHMQNLCDRAEIKDGEKINVVVPTGNFGNILAAYYAKQMGLPVHKLICASNDNKVLYDFFQYRNL